MCLLFPRRGQRYPPKLCTSPSGAIAACSIEDYAGDLKESRRKTEKASTLSVGVENSSVARKK